MGEKAMLLKETLKEMNRLKSNCSANSSIYALLMVHCLLLLHCYGHACAPNPCSKSMHETTETNNANMRYPKSLTPSPTVARSARGERTVQMEQDEVYPYIHLEDSTTPFYSNYQAAE